MQRGVYDSRLLNQSTEELIAQLKTMIQQDPQTALGLSEAVFHNGKIPFSTIADIFIQFNNIPQLTQFSLKCMPDTADMEKY